MTTEKPRKGVIFSDEEWNYLKRLLTDLQTPGLRGHPLYVKQALSPNQFVAKLAMERAAQLREEYDTLMKGQG